MNDMSFSKMCVVQIRSFCMYATNIQIFKWWFLLLPRTNTLAVADTDPTTLVAVQV